MGFISASPSKGEATRTKRPCPFLSETTLVIVSYMTGSCFKKSASYALDMSRRYIANQLYQLGILSGYLGGWTDQIIMQVTNVAMALPSLPLTIILVAFLDASVGKIILAICITAWTSTARIIRSRVQQLKALPFMQIERTMGASGP